MRVKTWNVLIRAVEEGAAYGVARAHKHTDAPDRDVIVEHVIAGVMNAINEVFDFESPHVEVLRVARFADA